MLSDGSEAMIPHSAVGHLAESSNLRVACIDFSDLRRLGHVVSKKKDGIDPLLL